MTGALAYRRLKLASTSREDIAPRRPLFTSDLTRLAPTAVIRRADQQNV
jgi:hypothetical protein